jgi:hypothetical protein
MWHFDYVGEKKNLILKMLIFFKGYVGWNFMWHNEYIEEKKIEFEVVGFFSKYN